MNYDINLMPKNNDKATIKVISIALIVFLIFVGIAGYFGYLQPVQERNRLRKNIQELNEELKANDNIDEEYNDLTQQVAYLIQVDQELKEIKKTNIKTTEIYQALEECMPKDIVIDKLAMTQDRVVSIEGSVSSHKELAEFIVNLRKEKKVLAIKFLKTENGDLVKPYEFSIQFVWDAIIPSSMGDSK